MLRKKKKASIILTILGSILVHSLLFSQDAPGHAYFPLYNFSSKAYNAQEMNVAIARDNRGLMYFANTSGILEYDGVRWRLIKLSNERVPRSLTTDKNGRIFVGSENEIGYLSPDSTGNMRYLSLGSHLPEGSEDFGVVWNVYSKDSIVVFQTYNSLLIWNGSEIKIVGSASRIHEFFLAGNSFYARLEGIGLTRFDGNTFKLVSEGGFFANKLVYGIIQLDTKKILIATYNEGLFIINTDSVKTPVSTLKPFKTEADNYLRSHTIFNAIKIGSDRISIGTWGGGIVVINLEGVIQNIIEKAYGLQDEIILDQMSDPFGNIWLALSKGISRIEILSPVSFFNSQNGLEGTVQSIASFNDRIYAASNVGVFYLDNVIRSSIDSKFSEPIFRAIDNLTIECWDLLNFSHEGYNALLCVANDKIILFREDHKQVKLMNGIAYDIYQSKLDPARVYVGLENGLTSLYYSKGKWIKEEDYEGITETVSSISEDHLGNLWMGTLNEGVIKMNIRSFRDKRINEVEIFKFGIDQGVPSGPTLISQISGRLIIGTSKGLYKFVSVHNIFEPDSSFGVDFSDGSHYIHRISDQNDEKVWMVSFEQSKNKYRAGYLFHQSGKGYQWVSQPFARISESIQHSIFESGEGIVWFGGPEGIYRFDPKHTKDYNTVFHALIRKVSLSNGDTLFGGTNYSPEGYPSMHQPSGIKPILPYSQNSISFEFASLSGENESLQTFSYLLEGYDKKWSDWSGQSAKEYTNLNEGSYILRIKSRNIFGSESTQASFSFTILSPWYRTTLAYLGYAVLLALFILGIVKIYTRNLRIIIHERTAEVVRQKNEIEIINKEITDSIHYASRIQSAILPPEDYLSSILSDYFILYMPRDIVSGDFYWMHNENERLIIVTADCTGHGVPGAFMSMLGTAFLNEIVIRHEEKTADIILNELRAYVIRSLRQTGKEGENQDGMDISICIYDLRNMKAQFAGANNPLLLIRNLEIILFPADKMPIGIHRRSNDPFTLHEIELRKGDVFYTFTDGYADQFGGPDGKKFMMKRMKEMLLSIHKDDMKKQGQLLHSTITEWMRDFSQVDDILVMGIKI